MQIEGTKQAFEALIQERGIYKKLEVDRRTVAGWKIYLREGKSISLDKMEEMLIKSGATVAQEKVWNIKMDKFDEKVFLFEKELDSKKVGDSITVNFLNFTARQAVEIAVKRHANALKCGLEIDRADDLQSTFKFIK